MGILDTILGTTDRQEASDALANLSIMLGQPMQPGENPIQRLITGTMLARQGIKKKRIEDADLAEKRADEALQRKYRELQMKKIEMELKKEAEPPGAEVTKWLDEAMGRENADTGMSETLPTRREKMGDMADYLEYQGKTKLTLPGEVYLKKYNVDINGQEVPLTTKQLIDYELKKEEQKIKKDKKIVKPSGHDTMGVYDNEGNLIRSYSVPSAPHKESTTKTKEVEKQAIGYLDKVYEKSGRKKKRFTPDEQLAYDKISNNVKAKVRSGMDTKTAVQSSLSEFQDEWKRSQPAKPAASGTIKTPNGVARIVQ